MLKTANVRDFGAIGDGVADDAPAFQAALDSGRPVVVVPVGSYLIGSPLFIGSDTKIMAHPRALIRLGDHTCTKRGDFLLTNRDWKDGGNRNITICGGIWDGNNRTNHKPQDVLYKDDAPSGAIMNFIRVENLTLSGLTLSDAGGYFTRFCRVNGFLIENITFRAFHIMPNNDGLHFCGFCENGLIRNLAAETPGSTSDDMVAFNADDIVTRCEALDMECGYIRNIVVDGLYADSCQSFVRLLSIDSEISNITVSNIRGGFYGMVVNMDAARYCMTPIVDPASPEYTRGVGCISNVTINHADVYCVNPRPDTSYIRLESNMENFRILDFHRRSELEASHETKTLRILNISPSSVRISGMEEDAAKRFVSGGKSAILSEDTDRYGETKASAQINTEYYEKFILDRGGFDSLEICRIPE